MIQKLSIFIFLILVGVSCKNTEHTNSNGASKPLSKEEAENRGLFIEAMRQKMIGNNDEAEAIFLEVLNRDSKNAAAHFQLSKIYDASSSILKALESAKMAYNLDSDNTWYQLQLASLYRKNGYYAESLEMYEEVLSSDPKNLDYQIHIAEVSYLNNDIERSLEALDAIIKNIGPQPEIVARKIQMLLDEKKYKEAEKAINSYIKENPKEVALLEIKADLYKTTGEKTKLIETYKKIAELNPSNSQAQFVMAEEHARNGDNEAMMKSLMNVYSNPEVNIDTKVQLLIAFYEESNNDPLKKKNAFTLMDTLIQVHPEEAKAFSIYGDFLLRDEKFEASRQKFEKAAELDPSRFPIWNQLLLLDIELSDANKMIEHGSKAKTLFPSQPITYLVTGIGHLRKKEYEKAIDELNSGKNLISDNEVQKYEFYLNLGEAYYATKQLDEAFENYEKAVQIDDKNPYLLNNYAYYLSLAKRNLEEAEELSKRANEILPDQSSFEDTYAYILFVQKDYKKAWDWIQKAVEHNNDKSGTILEHAGDIAFFLDKKEEAMSYWKQAAEREGASEVIQEKIETGQYVEGE